MLLAACGGAEAEPAGEAESAVSATAAVGGDFEVVATTSILADVVSNVVGEDATVTTVMPAGADPHEFEPTPQQIEAMNSADLLVANGAGLEEGFVDVIDAAEQEGVVVLRVADELDLIPFGGHAEGEGEHAEEEDDPHVWQDPVRMAEGVRLLGAELAEVSDALTAEEWAGRADAYATELEEVSAESEEVLSAVPDERRRLVTNHEAFGYFAERYGFEIIGTVIPSGTTLAEPSAADLEDLATAIEDAEVPAIFAENTQPDQLAEALVQEVDIDVEVVELFTDSLGEAGSGAETYVDLLRTNAQGVADALG